MTLTQLETFMEIAISKSFTVAANKLGYAQSTVTTQIKQLEDELGTQIFERLGKTVVLTPAGEKLLTYAQKILQLEREIHLEVSQTDEPCGEFKIGISESLCYNRLPGILMDYKERFPKVDIRLSFVLHDTFPTMLKKGEVDLVYTLNPCINDDGLTKLYEKKESLGFYVSPSHPLADKKINEKDLDGVPLFLTAQNCSFRKMLFDDLADYGITPNIALSISSKEILKQFAINGLGIAFIPDMTAAEEVKNGTLKKLEWTGNEFRIYSQIFIHKDKKMNKAIEGFLEALGE